MASITHHKGDPYEMLEDTHSGLINYLFGKDRKKVLSQEKFLKFRQDLLDDILWLEFTRYSKDGRTMADEDFCDHLLLTATISTKKKKSMASIAFIVI